ncbi:MAG TPA: DUF5666 domain-containing protein [Thermoanaerobaculia bacterium]|nr:DUF5666 domain-containing protein [Thermoanaerobaculia bacterium]
MKKSGTRLTALLPILALLLLPGCGSVGVGDILGAVLGGGGAGQGGNYPSGSQSQDVRATVESVDTRGQRIELSYVNGRNSRATVYFDSRTRVVYQNRSYSPSDLERGDEVEIRLSNSRNNQPVADTITVLRSVSGQGGSNYPNNYPDNQSSDIEGTVDYVDDRSGRLELTNVYIDGRRANQRSVRIEVDNQTRVVYQNRSFRITDLERGDQVQVRLYNRNSSQYRADTITVTRSARR